MSLHDAMYAHLLADTDVNALVAGRIFKRRAKTGEVLPYIVFTVGISADHKSDMKDPSGLVIRRVQVNSYASSYDGVWVLAEHVRDALQGLVGTLGSGSDTLTVQDIDLDGEADIDIVPESGAQRGSQLAPDGVRQDFMIPYTESIPVHV